MSCAPARSTRSLELLSRGLVSSLDLVLTDYRLPNGATGAQVIELVRLHPSHVGIAGLVMTGDTSRSG